MSRIVKRAALFIGAPAALLGLVLGGVIAGAMLGVSVAVWEWYCETRRLWWSA